MLKRFEPNRTMASQPEYRTAHSPEHEVFHYVAIHHRCIWCVCTLRLLCVMPAKAPLPLSSTVRCNTGLFASLLSKVVD